MRISPASWAALSGLLDQALDLAPDARAEWLDRLAETQPQLAPALRRLLGAHAAGESQGVLSRLPSLEGVDGGRSHPLDLVPGQRVGPYLLVHVLGSGGMAEVWLARRDDGAFNREVALKLPRVSWLRRDLAVRFARERDILARLEHPHIARLYDAGIAADGLPYLAMEYVDGRPLTAWCDERRLGVAGRLRLFGQVLAAVQFAHANLVIHRDLKPSNILVTGEGQVRLLDFGIAKLLAGDEGAPQTEITRWAGRVLTPDYASPEQVRGEPLTIATDVYSLGVVLFELLAGARPYRLKVESVAQLEEAIVAADPVRASTAASPAAAAARGTSAAGLARRLTGDLDTILLKTLAKSPGRRYPTVDALAEDLERHLAGQPVLAQPASAWYRLRKFTARHRWAVLGSAGSVVALLAFAAVAVVEARRATAQQQLALAEARKANAVRDFLVEVLATADPSVNTDTPARDITIQQAVDLAARRIDPSLTDQPEVKLAVLNVLAGVYSSLDRQDRSLALMKEALALSEKHDGVPHRNQAEILAGLANLEMFAGHFDEATRWVERAEALFAQLGDTRSVYYAQALKIRGNLERRGSHPDFQRALASLEKASALFRERYPKDEGRLGTLFYLAQTLRSLGEADRAEAIADEAVGLAAQGDTGRPGFDRPNALSLRAAIRESNGNLLGADADYAAAAPLYQNQAGPEHFLTLQNLGLRGMALVELGQRDAGVRLIEDSTRTLAKTRAGSPTHASAVERLGTAWVLVGRPDRAVPLLQEARALWLARQDALQRTAATIQLAVAQQARGRMGEARELLDEALEVRKKQEKSVLLSPAEAGMWRGLLALDEGDRARARRELAAVLEASQGSQRPELTRQVRAQAGLARLAMLEGDGAEALRAADRAVASASSPRLRQFPLMEALALEARGTTLCGLGRGDAGEPQLSGAEALLARAMDPGSPELARVRVERAACLLALGRPGEARSLVAAAAAALGATTVGPQFTEPLRTVQARLERQGR